MNRDFRTRALRRCWPLLIGLATGCGGGQAPAPSPAAKAKIAAEAEETRLVRVRDRHRVEASRLAREGRWDEAVRESHVALDLERRTKGNAYVVRDLLSDLIRLHTFREDWEAARKMSGVLISHMEGPMTLIPPWERQQGELEQADRLAEARKGPAELDRLSALPKGQGRRLGQAWRIYHAGVEQLAMGRAENARPALLEALAIRETILGENHLDLLACLESLGVLYHEVGELKLAQTHLVQSSKTRNLDGTLKFPISDVDSLASLRGLGSEYLSKDNRLIAKRFISNAALSMARLASASDLVSDHATGTYHYEHLLRGCVANIVDGKLDEAGKYLYPMSNYAMSELGEAHPLHAAILYAEGACHQESGEPAAALPLFRSAVAALKKALGEADSRAIGALGHLAAEHRTMGLYDQAEACYREALELRKRSTGEVDPAYAAGLDDLGDFYLEVGDPARAEPLFRRASEILQGAKVAATAESARNLEGQGGVHLARLDLGRAESSLLKAREIRQALGYNSYAMAGTLGQLSEVAEARGDLAGAERFENEAFEVANLGTCQELVYARCLRTSAARAAVLGNYAKAERLARAAVERTATAWKGTHPDHAASLATLAALFSSLGDHDRAEPLLIQARAIRMALDPAHPDHAAGLDQLANLYARMGDPGRAEPLFRQAIDAHKLARGGDRRAYAATLGNLATLYRERGELGRAEPLLIEAREVVGKARGDSHVDYATCLDDLASLYREKGDLARAEPLVRGALAIRKAVLGEAHPLTARCLANLGLIERAKGDLARAEPTLREALESTFRSTFEASATLDARRKLRLIKTRRELLDAYLGVALARGVPAAEIYRPVLAWKGGATVEPGEESQARNRGDLSSLVFRLQEARARLTRLAFINRNPANQAKVREGFEQARTEKETLEAELAAKFGKAPRRYSAEEFDPKRVADALADDRSLVDLFGYAQDLPPEGGQGPRRREARLLAFVVRRGKPVAVVPLGPASPIDRAVEDWRRALYSGQADALAEAAGRLNRLAWEPIRPHLGDVRTVLIAPDGNLARFPFAALPGREPGSYLIEDMAIGYVPSGRSLFDAPAVPETKDDHGLMAVGDVEFQADPNFFPERDPKRARTTTGPIARFGRYDLSIGPGGMTFTDVGGPMPGQFGGGVGFPSPVPDPFGGTTSFPSPVPRQFGGGSGFPSPVPGLSGKVSSAPDPLAGVAGFSSRRRAGPFGGAAGSPYPMPGGFDGEAGSPFSVPGQFGGFRRPETVPRPNPDVPGPDEHWRVQEVKERPPTAPPANAPGSGFAALPGTKVEIQVAGELFRQAFQSDPRGTSYSSIVWTGHFPTEGRIKHELDGTRTRFVHFATHGFFESPARIAAIRRAYNEDEPSKNASEREALPYDLTPLLRCGIVLAGGGRPPIDDPSDATPREDGILTAEEVQALDLRGTQLVVLSACETGLGSLEAGQGVVGLQGAFQSAGARAVVASLWKVDDAATSLLMERFYTNLWSRKLPRLEALRQAQIEILKGPKQVDQRRVELAARGIAPLAQALPTARAERPGPGPVRSDPALWAAFLLSGEGW